MKIYGFLPEEIDTITIIKYERNSNFSNPLDSSIEIAFYRSVLDYHEINFGIKTSESVYDYKIIINKINRVYTITGVELEEVVCNPCFPYINQNKYNRIKSYFLNGVRQNDFQIVIYK